MKTKDWTINAIIAALYVVVTGMIAPLAFGAYQFRISEVLNHLGVFHRKYIIGIILGVFLSNLFFSQIVLYDIVFGVGHSLVSLVMMRVLTKKNSSVRMKMVVNTLMFVLFSFIIAAQLYLAAGFPFWFTYFTVAVGEAVVMGLGIPVAEYLNKRLSFSDMME